MLGKGQGTSRGAGPREGSGREGAASRPTSGTPGCVLSVHNRQALARTGSWFFPISFCACACRSQITAAGKISHAALPPCVPACLRACVSPPFPCPHALCIMHHARTSHSDSVGLTESPEQHSTLTGAHSPHSPLVAQWCTALPPSARATPSSHRTSHCCSSHCCFTADDGLARERRGRNWGRLSRATLPFSHQTARCHRWSNRCSPFCAHRICRLFSLRKKSKAQQLAHYRS